MNSEHVSRRHRRLAAILLCACFPAHAHMPYLLPNVFDIGKREYVTVQGSFTEEFFEPDVAMKADDYHVIGPDGVKHSLTPLYTRDLAVIEVPAISTGTYRISTGVRTGRTAKATWVNEDWEFLGRDATPPSGSAVYEVTSVTTADVFVSRGKPSDAAVAPRNSGLEFRALTHPSSIFVGADAKFVVLFDGKPVGNQLVSVHGEDTRYADKKIDAELRTDANGQFVFKADRSGRYVAITRFRPAPTAGSSTALSYTYSVVFEAVE